MKILIIEDEENAAARLQKLIRKVIPDCKIIRILESVSEGIDWFQKNTPPDLLFLDIQLSDGLSFSIFKKVTINCPVIFTTAYDEYAIKAFELNSIDYLLKPVYEDKLVKSLEKYHNLRKTWTEIDIHSRILSVAESLKMNEDGYKSRFLIQKADCLMVVPVSEVAWFVSEHKETELVTKDNKKHIIPDSLEKLEQQLDPKVFYRLNRQYIVSICSIVRIHNHFNYKLKLSLEPPAREDIILDRKKVGSFKKWLNG